MGEFQQKNDDYQKRLDEIWRKAMQIERALCEE